MKNKETNQNLKNSFVAVVEKEKDESFISCKVDISWTLCNFWNKSCGTLYSYKHC